MVEAHPVNDFLLVGYGNVLRGDDRLGPYIVEKLQDILSTLKISVKTIILPQLDIILANELQYARVVIFVDARNDDENDIVRIEQIERDPEPFSFHHTSHSLSIPHLLRIAHDWYAHAPLCYMVSVKGYDFSVGETLSSGAEKAAEYAVKEIVKILQTIKIN